MPFKKKDTSKSSDQVTATLSTIAKEHSIRISKPYGYYPEDVDRVLSDLERENADLKHENKVYEANIEKQKANIDSLTAQIMDLNFQISNFQYPDPTDAQDAAMMSKLSNISDKVDPLPPEPLIDDPDAESKVPNVVLHKVTDGGKKHVTNGKHRDTFNELLTPVNHKGGER